MLDERLPFVVLQLAGLAIRHSRDLLEALLDVSLPHEAIEGEVRGVALQAGSGLLPLGHAPGFFLVEEGIQVAAPVTVVRGRTRSPRRSA